MDELERLLKVEKAADDLVNGFAWSAVRADCEEARDYLSALIARVREALLSPGERKEGVSGGRLPAHASASEAATPAPCDLDLDAMEKVARGAMPESWSDESGWENPLAISEFGRTFDPPTALKLIAAARSTLSTRTEAPADAQPLTSAHPDAVTSRSPSPEHMRMALIMCADTFRYYARSHREKGTPEGDEKAQRNDDMAAMCQRAIGPLVVVKDEPADAAPQARKSEGEG